MDVDTASIRSGLDVMGLSHRTSLIHRAGFANHAKQKAPGFAFV